MTIEHGLTAPTRDVLLFFRALADEPRLAILRLLLVGDLRSSELGERLHLSTNKLAYHLKQLRSLGLLRDHRSHADARDVYHRLDLDRLSSLYREAGDFLHPGLTSAMALTARTEPDEGNAKKPNTQHPLRVLFLCTHNSARSQLAEGILRRMGGNQVEAFSAGSEPTAVDPDAITVMQALGIDPMLHTAKSLTTFAGQQFDYIITVCDRVRDVCPVFPGDPKQIHWSIADPTLIEEPERRLAAFRATAHELTTRIRYLLLLPHPATGERLQPRE